MFAVTLHDLRPGEAWRQLAACRGMDPALFYPENTSGPDKKTRNLYPPEAKAACNRCPVRKACLDYAVNNGERFGLWGGKTPTERKKLRGTTIICRACGCQYERSHGGYRYCPDCRPSLAV